MSDVIQFPGGTEPPDEPPPLIPGEEGGGLLSEGDLIMKAVRVAEEDSHLLMSLLARMIRYQDYCLEMKIDRFTAVLRLAMLDQFTSVDEKAKARKISSPSFTFREADVAKARESKEYAKVHGDLVARLAVITSPSFSVDDLALLMEDSNAWELLRLAHFSGSAQNRISALKEFTDRRSAKKTRDMGGREMVLPERFVEQLAAGAAVMMAVLGAGSEARISAGELNVPRLIGEGTTSG